MFTFGDKSLLSLPKTAFLSSDKFSAGSVLKSYDWAAEMRRQNRCVISGFQSKLERDVFGILLKGTQAIILVLARGIYAKAPVALKPHVETGRLLIVSPFETNVKRITRDLASERNQCVISLADEVVVAHVHRGGMLEKTLENCTKHVMVLA